MVAPACDGDPRWHFTATSSEQIGLTRRVRIAELIRAKGRHSGTVESMPLAREFEAPRQQIRERSRTFFSLTPLRVVILAAAHLPDQLHHAPRFFRYVGI